MKRWMIPLAVVLLIALVAGAGYIGFRSSQPEKSRVAAAPPTVAVARGDVQQTVTAPGQLVDSHQVLLSSGVAGRLARVNVHPGDSVKAGDVLAQLDDTDLQYALQTAKANLASAQAKLSQLQSPPDATDLAAAQAQVESAQAAYDAAVSKNAHNPDQITLTKAQLDKAAASLQSAQAAYDKVAWRSDIGSLPQAVALRQATDDYEAAQATYNLALASVNDSAVKAAAQVLAQAQANLAKLNSSASPGDLAVAKSSVDSAQVAVVQAQGKLNQTKIVAPFDGIIQDVKVSEGETLSAGTVVVQLADPKALEARTTVTEEDYPLVQVGQEVQVYLDARPDVVAHGKVTQLVPLRDAGSSPLYPVYISLDEVPQGVASGMTVDASIQIAKQANVLRLPRSLANARSDGTAQVKVWMNGQSEERTIQTGLRGDQYVEILNGLREGDLVISR